MKLIIFGYGYTAQACAKILIGGSDKLTVTVRSIEKRDLLKKQGINAYCFDGCEYEAGLQSKIQHATHCIVSAPPDETGDPVLRCFDKSIKSAFNLKSIIYLSTIGVYGNFDGAWIDEATIPNAVSVRAKRRLAAEKDWSSLGNGLNINTHILRLAGIYGKGRNALCDFANGTARRIYKENQVFNRIHVSDIGRVVARLHEFEYMSRIWNVCDDMPCPPQDVVLYAANLLDVEPPPLQPFEAAVLTEMGKAFYSENKRVSNKAVTTELGFKFKYPTYKEGLQALFAQGEGMEGTVTQRTKRR